MFELLYIKFSSYMKVMLQPKNKLFVILTMYLCGLIITITYFNVYVFDIISDVRQMRVFYDWEVVDCINEAAKKVKKADEFIRYYEQGSAADRAELTRLTLKVKNNIWLRWWYGNTITKLETDIELWVKPWREVKAFSEPFRCIVNNNVELYKKAVGFLALPTYISVIHILSKNIFFTICFSLGFLTLVLCLYRIIYLNYKKVPELFYVLLIQIICLIICYFFGGFLLDFLFNNLLSDQLKTNILLFCYILFVSMFGIVGFVIIFFYFISYLIGRFG